MTDQEVRLEAFTTDLRPSSSVPKGYEVLLIHAGQANGWNFSRQVLRDSVPMFDGVDCFADHNLFEQSVHELCGVFSNPRWSDERGGVLADLRPTGPQADLLRIYAEDVIASAAKQSPHPNVGFSPVLVFQSKENGEVSHILRVRSCDLVVNPAFKTSFIKAKFNSPSSVLRPSSAEGPERNPMTEPTNPTETVAALQELTGAQREIDTAVRGMQEAHLLACQNLLASSLDAALDLPEPAKQAIRADFQDRTFKPAELQTKIKAWRESLAQSQAPAEIVGPTRVTAMFNSEDQMQAAMDDLLGAPRDGGHENLKVHRFSGIREAYLMLTNDFNFVGDVDQRLAQFQSTTATFPQLVKNALNKAIVRHWKEMGRAGYNWWEKIATIEAFETLNQITWLITGTIASLPVVAEGDDYTELQYGDNGETSDFVKYGGYLEFTLEAMDRDNTRLLRAAPRELANAVLRNISQEVSDLFTDNSDVGPTLADGGALFNATAVTTAGGHANLLTTALSAAQWEVVKRAVYDQPMHVANSAGNYGTGKKQAIDPRFLLVPRALQLTAMQILYPALERATDIYTENLQRGEPGDVITVPEWSDANNYAAVVDPMLIPGVMIGTRFGLIPQIVIAGDQRDPAMFANDASRLKVRHFLAVGVGNWRALHKSNVA